MQRTLLRQSIRQALAARAAIASAPESARSALVVAALGLVSNAVLAQDAPQDQNNQQLETITVTGSNIRRVDIETSNPVVTIDRALASRDALLALGHAVEWHEYPMEHSVSMEEIADLNAFLLRVLGS